MRRLLADRLAVATGVIVVALSLVFALLRVSSGHLRVRLGARLVGRCKIPPGERAQRALAARISRYSRRTMSMSSDTEVSALFCS